MKFALSAKGNKGFSLVELMVVVAIIGVLAALAIPKFQVFQAKAKQSEAKNNLSHIYTLMQTYYSDNAANPDSYTGATLAGIGFKIDGTARYAYTLPAVAASTFTGTATSIGNICQGSGNDVWTIDQVKTLTNTTNAANNCQ